MIYVSIGKNIKKLREENSLTQKELADIAGVTDKAVSMWEQGKREPRMGAMQKISDYFSVKMSVLMGETDFGEKNTQKNLIYIPIVDFIPAYGHNLSEDEIIGYENVSASFAEPGGKYIFYKFSDDNMEPVLKSGDLLLIQLKNYIQSGAYCAISVDGNQPFIKKLIFTGDKVELINENKNYENCFFMGEALKRLSVYGEIKKLIRNF